MVRRPSFGTPERMQSYLDPDREEQRRHPDRVPTLRLRSWLNWGAVAAGLVLLGLTSSNTLVSNSGPLSSGHARFERSCEVCHRPASFAGRTAALNASCSDCHDRLRRDALHTVEAHVRAFAPQHPQLEAWSQRFACIDCHTEHLGRDASITMAPERLCVQCHGALEPPVTSFASGHPEFAVLQAEQAARPDRARALAEDQAEPEAAEEVARAPLEPLQPGAPLAPGLRFTHRKHLEKYLPKALGAATPPVGELCARCHALEPDGRDLERTSFEQGCAGAGCHTLGPGSDVLSVELSEAIPLDLQALSEAPGPEPVPLLPAPFELEAAGLVPDGLQAARADFQETREVVEAQGSFTKRVRHRDPWILFAVEMLAREEQELAASGGPLRRSRLEQRLRERRGAPGGDPCADSGPGALPDTAQKQELCGAIALLDQEIAALDARLADLRPADSAPAEAPAAQADKAGQQTLEQLGGWLDALPLGEPHRSRLALVRTRLAEAASGQLLQAAAPIVDPRREDRARDELRRQLEVLAGAPSEWVQREVRTLQYKLDQLDEPYLPQAGAGAAGGLVAELERRRQLLDAERVRQRRQGRLLQSAARDCETLFLQLALARLPAAPPAPEEPAAWVREQTKLREAAIRRIARPCLQCHVLGRDAGNGRIAFAPVRMQEPQLRSSRFVHRPHLRFEAGDFDGAAPQAGTCGSCHAGILTSNRAEPVHFSGIESCRSCHNRKDVASTCQSCHTFHPAPGVARGSEAGSAFSPCPVQAQPARGGAS